MSKQTLLSWEFWLYNIVAAFIGGAANAVAAMVIAPETFNLQNLQKLGSLAVASGVISVAMYLKSSPLAKIPFPGITDTTKPPTTTT